MLNFALTSALISPICIIGKDKNSGQGKGWPKSDQNFQADFTEFLNVLIALKLSEMAGALQIFSKIPRRSPLPHRIGVAPHVLTF
jgi:hypothetical protein